VTDDSRVPQGLADLPLDVRRAREISAYEELQEGLTRRHLAIAAYERALVAANFATLVRVGPALAAMLRKG
jgi:hypothetical protein